MAQFLTTIEINSNIGKLIKSAKNELILITPYLQLSSRNRKLLAEQKNILKDGIHIVYRKDNKELPPEELDWLITQSHIHPRTLENLHAKCYLNEEFCIITSLNLYDYSQANNYEMGVLINKHDDEKLYKEAYAEAKKILDKSKEVNNLAPEIDLAKPEQKSKTDGKLTTYHLAKKLGLTEDELIQKLIKLGYLEVHNKNDYVTKKGKEEAGGLRLPGKASGFYFLWAENFVFNIEKINSIELAKKLGITTNDVIDKLVKSDYLKKEIGRAMLPDKYYLTEKGINIGIEEKDSGSIHEARFIYPENIQF